MDNMTLTSETDIYAFFEIIDKAEAEHILDVGMFLKRIGSVSRQVKDKGIPADKTLTGVDFFPEVVCPVWNTIYDAIYKPNEIFIPENHQSYELATVIQLEEYLAQTDIFPMWEWLSAHVSYVMTDWNPDALRKIITVRNEMEIMVDDKSYRFITL